MPFFSSIRAIGPTGARRLLAKLKAFVDNFARANNASILGEDVAKWTAVSGTWGITSNLANSTTPASSYPVATFDAITKDVSIKATGSGSGAGYGVSFWVTDSNNWWGAHTDKSTFTAAPYNCPSGGTANNTNGNCNYGYGASGGPYTAGGPYPCCAGSYTFGADCWVCCPWTKVSNPAGAPWCSNPYYTQPAPYNCPSGGSLSGSTCYVTYAGTASTWYKHDVKVVKKDSGTLSNVSTTNIGNVVTNNSAYISYVQANTGPSSAVITAQLSTGGPAVSITVPAGTPERTSKFGMISGPSTLSQTTQVETFEYTPL
jgi:hypothetical protein